MSINARLATLSYGLTVIVALAVALLVVARLAWLAISGSIGEGSLLSDALLLVTILAFAFPGIRAALRLKHGRPLLRAGERPVHFWNAWAIACASVGHLILAAVAAAIFLSAQGEREEIGLIALPLMAVAALYVIALWIGEFIALRAE